MKNRKPIDQRHRRGVSRSTWQGSTAIAAAVLLVLSCAAGVEAGNRRARLSSDLVAHLNSNSSAAIDIIVSGSQERIDRLVKRHGLVVRAWAKS